MIDFRSGNQARIEGRRLLDLLDSTLAADPYFFQNYFEGQSNVLEVARETLLEIELAKTHPNSLGELIQQLRARKARLRHRQGSLRDFLLRLMEDCGPPQLKLDIGTLSIAHRGPAPIWPDEIPDALPDEFIRTRRELNRIAIKQALEAGAIIPGISIDNGAAELRVRVS